jgi:hypothetical protein
MRYQGMLIPGDSNTGEAQIILVAFVLSNKFCGLIILILFLQSIRCLQVNNAL